MTTEKKKKDDKFTAFFKSFSATEDALDFKRAHETIGEKFPVISTGSIALDDALSSGGIPRNRLVQYYGSPGSGKTLCAMIAMLEAQKLDPNASQLFIDAEGTFDPKWAALLGLNTSKVLLVSGDTAVYGRKCFEMLLGVPKEDAKTHELKGKSTEGFLDKITSGEFNVNMIVLDSLGSIIPPMEDTSRVGKMNMSLLARFLTTTFRKLSLELQKAKVPMIIVNHKKDNMDPYGADHTFSGGNTYSHFLSANIYFEAVQRKDSRILDEKEQKIGHPIRATIEKSKFGPWPRTCEFKVQFDKGIIDRHEEVINLAIAYDVITKPTSVTYAYGDQRFVGVGKLSDAVQENPELMKDIENKINDVRNNKLEKARLEQEEKINLQLEEEANTLTKENIV